MSSLLQVGVLGQLLFFLCTSKLFSILGSRGCAGRFDDSTLTIIVPSKGVRVTVAESLKRDLVKISEWVWPLGDEIKYE